MRRQDRAFWKRIVVELERSELSHAEFAREHGVALATLRSWVYRLRREAGASPFVPVRVVASTAPSARRQDEEVPVIEAVTASGLRLRFQVGADLEYVAELLRRLG